MLSTLASFLAIMTMVFKRSYTPLDITVIHTYANFLIFSLTFTAGVLCFGNNWIKAGVIVLKTSTGFLAVGTSLLTVGALQQLIAIAYPLKVKMWITKKNINITAIALYSFMAVYNVTEMQLWWFKIVDNSILLDIKNHLMKVCISILVLLHFATLYNFVKQRYRTNSISNARVSGQYRDRKTIYLMSVATFGAILMMVSRIGIDMDLDRTVASVMVNITWFLSPATYIVLNRTVWKQRFKKQSRTDSRINMTEAIV